MVNISVATCIILLKAIYLRRGMKQVIKTFEGGSYFRINYAHTSTKWKVAYYCICQQKTCSERHEKCCKHICTLRKSVKI